MWNRAICVTMEISKQLCYFVQFIETPQLSSSLAHELLPTAPAPANLPTLHRSTHALLDAGTVYTAPGKPHSFFLCFPLFWSFLGTLGQGGFHNEWTLKQHQITKTVQEQRGHENFMPLPVPISPVRGNNNRTAVALPVLQFCVRFLAHSRLGKLKQNYEMHPSRLIGIYF